MSFWNDLAVYCEHLAPCATPAIAAVGHVASSVASAERQLQAMRNETEFLYAESARFDAIHLLPEDDFYA
jgi:hypothetical protein